ncbi:MAG: response regulator transcription factor [Bacteroidia bacterium]|nr:response regulator transcription factor [Bacteroidia bacterium]
MHKKAAHITQMLEAGASGYILKENGRQELLVALQAICQGKQYFGQAVTQELIRGIRTLAQNPKAILTKREKEIIILIANGKTTPEIAEQLFIAESTVNTHRRNIIEKLGVGNIKGLVKYATQNGYC